MQNLVNNWLVNHGFTVGVQDIIAAPSTNVTITNALNKHKRQVQRIVQRTQRGQLEKKAGLGMQESFET
jgi:DNA-directed RNA polymerase II subunit RPB1